MGTWSEHGPMSFKFRTLIYVYRKGLLAKFEADSIYIVRFMLIADPRNNNTMQPSENASASNITHCQD